MPPLQDEITLPPSSPTGTPLLIFFVSGNPGLIEYYRSFLLHLHQKIQSTSPDSNITIYGASHSGFEIHLGTPRMIAKSPPFSLQEVIESVKLRLLAQVRQVAEQSDGKPVKVVLMGHSVGAYMLLEVLAWWQRENHQREECKMFEVVAGIGLFPTVVDIAKSPRGKILSWLLAIPSLPMVLQTVARGLACVPTNWINWPRMLNPGPEAVDVTEAMIRSPNGVGQVIYMANDEMREIREDKWHPANVWGMLPHSNTEDMTESTTLSIAPKTKLFFYWGKNDYWVNNKSRDALIAARAQTKGTESVSMYIDPGEIPHTFSLETKDMVTVAEKVGEWIKELQMGI